MREESGEVLDLTLPPNKVCPQCGSSSFKVRYSAVVEEEVFVSDAGAIIWESSKPWGRENVRIERGKQLALICSICEKEISL